MIVMEKKLGRFKVKERMKKIGSIEEAFKEFTWEFGKIRSLVAIEHAHSDYEMARFIL